MMYGQMTAGSWIYIGSQGIVQGTYETFAEIGPAALWRHPRRALDSHRRPRRHGRRAAARRDHGGRLDAGDRVPAERASRCGLRTGYLDAQAQRPRRGAGDDRARLRREQEGRFRRPARQCGRDFSRAGAARRQARRRHRPDLGARSGQRLSAGRLDASTSGRRARERDPKARRARRRGIDGGACARDAGVLAAGVPTARLRQQHPPDGAGRWASTNAFDFPGLRAGLYPPAVLPRHRTVPLGRALGRSGGHLSAPTPR